MRKSYSLVILLVVFATSLQAQLSIFADDYAPGISFSPFGGAVNNLTIDAANARPGSSGTKSLKAVVPAGNYTGGALLAASDQNVTTYNAVSFWVKASRAVTLDVTGLGNTGLPGGLLTFQVETRNILLSTSWVRVIIPIPDASKLNAVRGMWHFAEGFEAGDPYDLWFDDIQYETISSGITGPSVAMDNQTLTKALGATVTAANVRATYGINSVPRVLEVAPAYLNYTCSPVGRITFDAAGVGTTQNAGAATVTATLGAIAVTGTINVTVTGGANAPSIAAPTPPARNVNDVISVFSNAYTNIGGVNFNPGWGQGTVFSEVAVASNATLKYASLNYQGFEIGPSMNLTSMTKLHFDIWSADCSEYKFFLISPSPTVEAATTVIPTLGSWKSVDVNLSSFSPVILSNVFQMKMEGQPWGASTVYIDNIYFYREPALPVKLVDFTAKRKGNAVDLNWSTATETNNKGFGVERSADGQNWASLTFVKSKGNNAQSYAATDATPGKGMNYYRLKQEDVDGAVTYSAVKAVSFNSNKGVAVYPNPAKGKVNIYVDEMSGKANYTILNLNGKQVLSGFINAANTANVVDISSLPAGTYMVRITGTGINVVEKLFVQ